MVGREDDKTEEEEGETRGEEEEEAREEEETEGGEEIETESAKVGGEELGTGGEERASEEEETDDWVGRREAGGGEEEGRGDRDGIDGRGDREVEGGEEGEKEPERDRVVRGEAPPDSYSSSDPKSPGIIPDVPRLVRRGGEPKHFLAEARSSSRAARFSLRRRASTAVSDLRLARQAASVC